MSDSTHHKLLIIGSGPAGWTASIYAARAQLDPVCYVGVPKQTPSIVLPGGQLMLTTEVENYPGFPEGVTGPDMMQKFQKQAERFGTKVVGEDITSCDFSKRPFTLQTSGGKTVTADAVIIATGATANWLGLDNEMRLATSGGGRQRLRRLRWGSARLPRSAPRPCGRRRYRHGRGDLPLQVRFQGLHHPPPR